MGTGETKDRFCYHYPFSGYRVDTFVRTSRIRFKKNELVASVTPNLRVRIPEQTSDDRYIWKVIAADDDIGTYTLEHQCEDPCTLYTCVQGHKTQKDVPPWYLDRVKPSEV